MSILAVLDLTLHKTKPQYRAGLLHIFTQANVLLHEIMLPTSKVDFLSSLNSYAYSLEKDHSSEQTFCLGVYAGLGWFQHLLANVQILNSLHVNELFEHIQKNICEIDKLST